MANSIKNTVNSVDWSKMFDKSDARNALIGSALGGLLLGGSSLMAEHDPEEGKYAPLGDALTGALLGGIAGYGVPKGLSMFRDAGSLAPDSDRRGGIGGYLATGLTAGGLGAGAVGLSLIPTHLRAIKKLRDENDAMFVQRRESLIANAKRLKKIKNAGRIKRFFGLGGRSVDASDLLTDVNLRYRAMIPAAGPGRAEAIKEFDALVSQLEGYLNSTDAQKASDAADMLKKLRRYRRKETLGFGKYSDIERAIGMEGTPTKSTGPFSGIRNYVKGFSNGGHYSAKTVNIPITRLWGRTLPGRIRIRPGLRMLGRAAKYGLGAASVAMALKGLFGSGISDNYDN